MKTKKMNKAARKLEAHIRMTLARPRLCGLTPEDVERWACALLDAWEVVAYDRKPGMSPWRIWFDEWRQDIKFRGGDLNIASLAHTIKRATHEEVAEAMLQVFDRTIEAVARRV